MSDHLFQIILATIPVICAVVAGSLVPYLKTRLSSAQMDEISRWVTKAVQAAEVLFDAPESGAQKRDYVIHFIQTKFNVKKELITEEQICILLEAAWKEMTESEF